MVCREKHGCYTLVSCARKNLSKLASPSSFAPRQYSNKFDIALGLASLDLLSACRRLASPSSVATRHSSSKLGSALAAPSVQSLRSLSETFCTKVER